MEDFKIFLANNYIWFIVLACVFLFALIGYLLDSKRKQKEIEKTEVLDTIKVETPVEELKMDTPVETLTTQEPKVETLDIGQESPSQEQAAPVEENTIQNTVQDNNAQNKEEEIKQSNAQVESVIKEELSDESTFQG